MRGGPRLRLVPVNRDQALDFVARVHRTHGRPLGYRYAVGVAAGDRLVGVALSGRPVARMMDDGHTIEVIRVATDGTPNACSALYGACWRAARALGYSHAITYTQDDESGASVRAAGWLVEATIPARPGWDRPSRRRDATGTENVARTRWGIRSGLAGEWHMPDPAVGTLEPPGQLDLLEVTP